eukprot:364970-Chlamydomonas_euryale.AAC.3
MGNQPCISNHLSWATNPVYQQPPFMGNQPCISNHPSWATNPVSATTLHGQPPFMSYLEAYSCLQCQPAQSNTLISPHLVLNSLLADVPPQLRLAEGIRKPPPAHAWAVRRRGLRPAMALSRRAFSAAGRPPASQLLTYTVGVPPARGSSWRRCRLPHDGARATAAATGSRAAATAYAVGGGNGAAAATSNTAAAADSNTAAAAAAAYNPAAAAASNTAGAAAAADADASTACARTCAFPAAAAAVAAAAAARARFRVMCRLACTSASTSTLVAPPARLQCWACAWLRREVGR